MSKSDSVDEYLEALWRSEEEGKPVSNIKTIAKRIGISPPSVVEMLRKMEDKKLVKYIDRKGASLTLAGRKMARQIVRNHRLIELLMKNTIKTKSDEETVCAIEHHITEEFADALCKLLNHPKQCPHGEEIPAGKCCK